MLLNIKIMFGLISLENSQHLARYHILDYLITEHI